jgi:hypothetical protein
MSTLRNLIQQLLFVFLQGKAESKAAKASDRRHKTKGSNKTQNLFGNLERTSFAWVCASLKRFRRLEMQTGAELVAACCSGTNFGSRLDLMGKVQRVFLLLHFAPRVDG